MNPELKKKLIEAIDHEIGNCKESGIYPNICGFLETEAGYNRIQEDVINLVKNEGMRIDSALAQIESNI